MTGGYGNECWALKGKHEKKVSGRNEKIKMDVWLHKKGPPEAPV